MVARLHPRRDTRKGPMAVRAISWGRAAFLACFLATEPLCVHMVVRLELVPPSAGGWGLWSGMQRGEWRRGWGRRWTCSNTS